MGKVTTRPNATVSNDWTDLVGAATAHAATSDDSDASYVGTSDTAKHTLVLGFAEPTIPAGALIKQDRIYLRMRRELILSDPATYRIDQVTAKPDGSTAFTAQNIDVNWSSATKVAVLTFANNLPHSDLQVSIAAHAISGAPELEVLEAYWETTYVEKPTVDSVSVVPASPISTDDTPTFQWEMTSDGDGGFPTKFQVRVFTDEQYLAGGFDPSTSTPTVDSGVVDKTATSWESDTPLADDTYRAYVRVANVVNGAALWSDWNFVQFDLAVLRPGNPVINALVAESSNGRIRLNLGTSAGATTTTWFQVQRSLDGGVTWDEIRTVLGLGLVTPGDTIYDYEVANGQSVIYQARALHDFGNGTTSKSDWVQTGSISWSSTDQWLKHPTRPDLNIVVRLADWPEPSRPARDGIFQPAGSDQVVVVSDKRQPAQGDAVVFQCDTQLEVDDLDAIIADEVPLLLQTPADVTWVTDRWVKLRDLADARLIQKKKDEHTIRTFGWIEVGNPTGTLRSWL